MPQNAMVLVLDVTRVAKNVSFIGKIKKNMKFRFTPDDLDFYIYECIGNLKISQGHLAFKFFLFPK